MFESTGSWLGLAAVILVQTGSIIIAVIKTSGKTRDEIADLRVCLAGKVDEKDCEQRRKHCVKDIDTRIVRHAERHEEQVADLRRECMAVRR
jgi:DNA-binding Lrp family transcriptional regulator